MSVIKSVVRSRLALPPSFGSVMDVDGRGPSLDLNFINGAPLDSRITFARASSATYFDATGAMQTAGNNVPRLSFDPVTLAPRGFLLEEQRTNLLLNSTALSGQGVPVTAQAYTLSFYGTGTVTLSGAFAGTLIGSGAFPTRSTLTFTPIAGTLTLAVSGTVTNAQLEVGAFATAYITTAGATATRAADSSFTPIGPWFKAGTGSFALEYSHNGVTPSGFPRVVQMDDGTTGNALSITLNVAGGDPFAFGAVAGVTQWSIPSANVFSVGSIFKGAVGYAANSVDFALNGAAYTHDSAAAVPTVTTLRIASDTGPVVGQSVFIRRLRYWPRALLAGELKQVTL